MFLSSFRFMSFVEHLRAQITPGIATVRKLSFFFVYLQQIQLSRLSAHAQCVVVSPLSSMIPSCPSAFVFLPRCLTFLPLVTVCRSSAITHSAQDLCKTYLLLSVAQPKTSCLLKLWSVYPALRLLGMIFAAHCCG